MSWRNGSQRGLLCPGIHDLTGGEGAVKPYEQPLTKKPPLSCHPLLDGVGVVQTMAYMTRKHSFITGIAVASMLVLGACSNNNDASSSESTVDTRVTPPTIAAGTQIELGSVTSEIQEVSVECAEALQPIRDLEKKFQSGLELRAAADLKSFNDSLSAGFKACSPDEWDRFQQKELTGWMNAVPSQEALEQAEKDAQNSAPTTETTEVVDGDTDGTDTTDPETTTTDN